MRMKLPTRMISQATKYASSSSHLPQRLDRPDDEADYKVTAYIFDSHRPYNINNVNDETKRIYCVDDGCKSFAECPTAQDVNDYLELQ